jgi:1-acyl-sn-glycerol-3-phosphate acyltransferase
VRFLIAFRHSTLDDTLCLHYLFTHSLARSTQRQQFQLKRPLYVHFLYDRGVPLWAGTPVGWLLPRLGATPIRRSKFDLQGLRSARELFTNGSFPLAVAPEGIINGHNERLGQLEPGAAQLGFWCLEDLYKAGRLEQVVILPIDIRYHYPQSPWRSLDRLLSQLEADCGLSINEIDQ